MPTLLVDQTLLDICSKLLSAFLDLWSEELRSADRHDRNGQLALCELLIYFAIFEACPVCLQYSTQTTRLLNAFNPMRERTRLDRGRIVALLFDEHLPELTFVALDQHFRYVWDRKEAEVLDDNQCEALVNASVSRMKLCSPNTKPHPADIEL